MHGRDGQQQGARHRQARSRAAAAGPCHSAPHVPRNGRCRTGVCGRTVKRCRGFPFRLTMPLAQQGEHLLAQFAAAEPSGDRGNGARPRRGLRGAMVAPGTRGLFDVVRGHMQVSQPFAAPILRGENIWLTHRKCRSLRRGPAHGRQTVAAAEVRLGTRNADPARDASADAARRRPVGTVRPDRSEMGGFRTISSGASAPAAFLPNSDKPLARNTQYGVCLLHCSEVNPSGQLPAGLAAGVPEAKRL